MFCYADGMTAYLTKRRMRIFGFTQFAKPLTDAIKANAEELAAANDLNIDYVRKKKFPQGGQGQGGSAAAGNPPGIGVDLLGLGAATAPYHHSSDRGAPRMGTAGTPVLRGSRSPPHAGSL